jgi:hypothetical protein
MNVEGRKKTDCLGLLFPRKKSFFPKLSTAQQ